MFSKGSPLNPPTRCDGAKRGERGDLFMHFQKVFSIGCMYAAFCRNRVYFALV